MKKPFVVLSGALLLISGSTRADVGASGRIDFHGKLVAESCDVLGGGMEAAEEGPSSWRYSMGDVSISELGSEAIPAGANSWVDFPDTHPRTAEAFTLTLLCDAGFPVPRMLLHATAGTTGKGLAVTGSATNVQIMLLDSSRGPSIPFDMSSGMASVDVSWAPDAGVPGRAYSGTASLSPYYTVVSGRTPREVKGGTANGSVAYVLEYD